MILGLDLAAKENKRTGYFYIKDEPKFGILYKNEEIIELIKKENFKYVFIDAPLSYEYPYRIEEKLLYEEGFKPLPLSLRSMKELYERANYIKNKIEEIGNIKVFETFPRAVEKILNLKYEYFKKIFKYKDIYDAYLSFLSGLFYLNGKYKKYGELILPDFKI
jgi:predicted nuclease with RNAse H fold